MPPVSLADAKSRLSELVSQAAAGESIEITRHGKPVAHLVQAKTPRKPVDVKALRALTESQRPAVEAAVESGLRPQRDAERY